jgi:UMF1 family MFS transporter
VGPLVGISLGSTWTASRALVVCLSPEEKIGEIFGLFSFMGKLSSITGILIWGVVVLLFEWLGLVKYRIALSIQILFMFGGWFILRKIPTAYRD